MEEKNKVIQYEFDFASEYETKFSDCLSFDIKDVNNKPLSSLSLSNKTQNILLKLNISNLLELLNLNVEDVKNAKNSNQKIIDDIYDLLDSLNEDHRRLKKRKNINFLIDYKDQIKEGDFSFSNMYQNEIDTEKIKKIKSSFLIVEQDFVKDCIDNKIDRQSFLNQLEAFCFEVDLVADLNSIIFKIPNHIKTQSIGFCLDVYNASDETKETILSKYASKESLLIDLDNTKINTHDEYKLICTFLRWFQFDLLKEINNVFNTLKRPITDKKLTILELRGKGQILEEVGNTVNLTKERIRQIEVKSHKMIDARYEETLLLNKLVAHFGFIISQDSIKQLDSKYNYVLLGFLKNKKDSDLLYNKDLKAFVYKDKDKTLWDYLETLPEILTKEKAGYYSLKANSELKIPADTFQNAIIATYKYSKGVYSKATKTLKTVIDSIISKYFPNGMRVYDPKELELFRTYVKQDFSGYSISPSNRALSVSIQEYCQLVDKGTYYLEKQYSINQELLDKLRSFIKEKAQPFIFIRFVFENFKSELEQEGILNKFSFQTLLRQLFNDEFYITKDYISTQKHENQLQETICKAIKDNKKPISVEELRIKLPNVSELSLIFSTKQPNIISFFGTLFHTDNIIITPQENEKIKNEITKHLSDKKIHTSKDTYKIIQAKYPQVLSRNFIDSHYSFYSVMEFLFNDYFYFKRPFISLFNIKFNSVGVWLKSHYEKDLISFDELSYFKNEVLMMKSESMLLVAHSCDDYYFFNGNNQLISITYSGITPKIVQQIEEILPVIKEKELLSNYLDIKLPTINVPWNDMLLYSALKKWSTKFHVSLSGQKMKETKPFIEMANNEEYKQLELDF